MPNSIESIQSSFSKNLVSIPKSNVSIPSSISEAQNHVDWFIFERKLVKWIITHNATCQTSTYQLLCNILNIMQHIKHKDNLLSFKTKSYKLPLFDDGKFFLQDVWYQILPLSLCSNLPTSFWLFFSPFDNIKKRENNFLSRIFLKNHKVWVVKQKSAILITKQTFTKNEASKSKNKESLTKNNHYGL